MPGHVKVPHRDDLIGLEAAYKSLENPTMIVKQLSEQNEIINVYLYENASFLLYDSYSRYVLVCRIKCTTQ